MQLYPEEIEADLYFRGVDIFDWYQGRISSRRVLALVRNLPPESAFKTAASDYDWPLQAHLTTGMWNEIKALRADMVALIAREHMSFKPVLPPSAERKKSEERALIRAVHDDMIAQMRGSKLG